MSASAFSILPDSSSIAKPGQDLITALPTELIREIIDKLSWNEALILTSTSKEYRRFYFDKILQRVFIPYGSLEGIPIIFNEDIITELILQPINSGHIMSTSSITKSLLDRRMPLSKLTRLSDLRIISDRALNKAPLQKKHEWEQLEKLLPPKALIHMLVDPSGLPPSSLLPKFRSIRAHSKPKHWKLVPKPLNLDSQYLTNLESYTGYALCQIWKCTKLTQLQCVKFPPDLRNDKGELDFNALSSLTSLRVLDLKYTKKTKFPLSRNAFRELTKLTNLTAINLSFHNFSIVETIPPFIFKQKNLRVLSICDVHISPATLADLEGVPWSHLAFGRNEEPIETIVEATIHNPPLALPNLNNTLRPPPLPTVRPYWVPDKDCSNCTRCGAEFTVTLRRHHCRNCGKIFCGHCCSKKLPLKHLGYMTSQLTCTDCYSDLFERLLPKNSTA